MREELTRVLGEALRDVFPGGSIKRLSKTEGPLSGPQGKPDQIAAVHRRACLRKREPGSDRRPMRPRKNWRQSFSGGWRPSLPKGAVRPASWM